MKVLRLASEAFCTLLLMTICPPTVLPKSFCSLGVPDHTMCPLFFPLPCLKSLDLSFPFQELPSRSLWPWLQDALVSAA